MSESSRDQQVQAILHEYLQALDAGEQPDRADIVRRHPELAAELQAFFADQEKMDQLAQSLHRGHALEGAITLPPSDSSEAVSPSPSSAAEEAEPPRIRYFGDYELHEEIARGGMGVVFKARQVSLNRTVALKMILQGELASDADMQRFRTEAEHAANLDHPHIVPIYEIGDHEGQQYFSMKLIGPGKRRADLGVKEIVRIMILVARAVHHAHQRGILHRDLKPGNILFDEKGDPHVADFGLAKRVGGDSGITRSGAIVGTPSYMAPEQARAEKVLTTAVDVYSLGAILYEWLTGQPPFRGNDVLATVIMVANDEPPRPRTLNPRIDRDLETIDLKCLAKDPARRYGSAEMLAEDLERWLRSEPIMARPVGRVERFRKWARRKPAQAAVLAVSVVAALALLISGMWFTKELRSERDNVQRERDNAERNLSNSYIMLAENAWNHTGTAELARDFLEKVPPAFRNWEWAFLHRKYQGSLFTIYELRKPTCVAWSSDGSRLASGNQNANAGSWVRIWDARSGEAVLEFYGPVSRLAWNGDSSRLAGASGLPGWSGRVCIWDAKSGKVLLEFREHSEAVTDLAWSPDGSQLATTSGDRTVRVWDATNGKTLFVIKTNADHVSWSSDGGRLATNSSGVQIWNARTGDLLLTLPVQSPSGVDAVSFSPEGNRVAAALQDGRVLVLDAWTGKVLHELKGHTDRVTSVAWSGDGTRLASGSYDETVRVWDARTGEALIELKGHRGHVTDVCWSDDGRRLASASEDYTVRVWDAQSDEALRPLPGLPGIWSVSAAWSIDGNRYAAGSSDKTVRVWEVQNDQSIPELKASGPVRGFVGGPNHVVHCIAWSPDGSRLACGGGHDDKGELQIWDAKTGQSLLELKGHTKPVNSVAWSPDGSRLASSAIDKRLRVWDAGSGESLLEFWPGPKTASVCWSPDSSRFASASQDWVLIWDIKTGYEGQLSFAGHNGPVLCVAWSPDGSRIASASHDKTVRIWDAKTGQTLHELKGHAGWVGSVCWSPDGSRIASGSSDKTVRVWDALTGQALLALRGHAAEVMSVAWSGDGTRILSVAADQRACIWDARPRKVPREHRVHIWLGQVFWINDGSRSQLSATEAFSGKTARWDVATGERLPSLPPGPLLNPSYFTAESGKVIQDGKHWASTSPDGKHWASISGPIVVLGTTELAEEERLHRRWLTRPDPQWHERKYREFMQGKNAYAAAVQQSLEQHARGVLALERGDADQASACFAAAAKLKPKPPPPLGTMPAADK